MPVFTDVERLAKEIELPPGVSGATWTVVAIGTSATGLGPTDTQLYALLSLDSTGWQALGPPGAAAEVRIPIKVAEAILPATLRSGLPLHGGELRISGPAYQAEVFENVYYGPVYAVRLGDQLLVCLQTT